MLLTTRIKKLLLFVVGLSVLCLAATQGINLANQVYGVLGISHGGTNSTATPTSGRYAKGTGTAWGVSTGSASGTGSPTTCVNQFITTFTLNSDAAPTSTCVTVGNAALTNSSLTVAATSPVTATGGAPVSLGGTVTIACPTCITTSGSGSGSQPIVTKSANYTITTSDFTAADFFVFSCSSSCDATLPASAPGINGQFVTIKNNGIVSIFVMPNGRTLDGQAAPLLLPAGYSAVINTDTSNYFSAIVNSHSQFASRRHSWVVSTGSATIVAVGTAINATAGTLSTQSATSTEGQFEKSATAAANNSEVHQNEVGGMIGIANTAANVRWSGRFGIDDNAAGVTSIRAFFGMADTNSTNSNYFGSISSDAPNVNHLIFRCSSSVPDSNWMALVGNSGGNTAASTGVTCDTTNHTFVIQEHGGATAYFYIDGVMRVCIGTDSGCTSAAGKYPAFAAAKMLAGITTLTAATRSLHFFWMEEESDH